MLRRSLLLLVAAAVPASSQVRSNTEGVRLLWREVGTYLTQAANDVPESMYAYKPTPDVRTFGELLDHIAASQNGYCLEAMGEKPTAGGAGTGATTKAQVVEALRASNDVCARAYGQTDAQTALPSFGSVKNSRLLTLFENASHDNEHYGNIVTYMRMNHMVPPSSQPAPPKP